MTYVHACSSERKRSLDAPNVIYQLYKLLTSYCQLTAQLLWQGDSSLDCLDGPSLNQMQRPGLEFKQLQRHQTKGLMRKTMAVHVRYKSLYISLEITKFCLFW